MTELSGLTEAIEAVIAHGHKIHERADGWLCSCGEAGTDRPVPGSKAHRHLIAVDLAVAAPILVTAALRQAADRIVANADGHPDRVGMDIAAAELRLTADSLHEGTTP